jgi:hypothetical protein
MDAVEASNLWAALPADLRDRIDQLIRENSPIQAIAALRDHPGLTPRPGLAQGKKLVAYRTEMLKAG